MNDKNGYKVQKISQTYSWRNLGGRGNQEPNETLTNRNSHQLIWAVAPQQEPSPPTCFQRVRPKPNVLPVTRSWLNNPTSMMTSNKMSVVSEPKILYLVISKLSKAQVFSTGDQAERSYSFQMSIANPI